jgi:hypothetical protein
MLGRRAGSHSTAITSPGIYMEYTRIYTDIHGISMDIPCISTQYIRGVSMDIHGYTWYIIRCGIYVVYPWIFLDIYSFLKPDFAAGPCCWFPSHSLAMSTAHKSLNPTAANLSPSVACGGGDGGGDSGVAGVFPFS